MQSLHRVEKSHSGMIRVALGQEISGLRVSIEHRQHNPQPLTREAGVNLPLFRLAYRFRKFSKWQ